MIHVLSQSVSVREQLADLFEAMEREYRFHSEVDTILKVIRQLGHEDHVFYDLQLEDHLWAFEPLYGACKKTHLVTFEPQTDQTSLTQYHCPASVDYYLLLPANPDRAAIRLREVFKRIAHDSITRERIRKDRVRIRKQMSDRTTSDFRSTQNAATFEATPTVARYLHARSDAMRSLLADIENALGDATAIELNGNAGAEFEQLAREINFRANGDAVPLFFVNPIQLQPSSIEDFLDRRKGNDQSQFIYLGMAADWSTRSAIEFEKFFDSLKRHEKRNIHLIYAHADESEHYCAASVLKLLRRLQGEAASIRIPEMAERSEDVPAIVFSAFSTLRMAHPFLRTQMIDNSAVDFLQQECRFLDHNRLIRIIRNAMAHSKDANITKATLRNLADDRPSIQHLIETLADERYFKTGSE